MAITITAIPDWLWVKNPVIVELTGASGDLDYAKIQIYDGETMLSEGYYVAKSDYLKADISGYLHAAFDITPNDRTGVTLYRPAETSMNLTIIVLVNDDDEEIYNELHTLIYGGKEAIDTFSIDDYVMVSSGTTFPDFLIEFDRIKIWKDQPFEMRFTADTGKAFTFGMVCYNKANFQTAIDLSISAQDDRGVLKVNPTALATPIPDDTVWIVISLKTGTDVAGYIIADYITPDCNSGVLLRWINRLGGIHLWYFRKRDTRRPVKTTTVPVPESIEYSNNWNPGKGKVVEKEKQKLITVGDELVPISDFEVIARIVESDRVDMYMGSGDWMQVIVQDIDFNTAHENDYQDIEFTIVTI